MDTFKIVGKILHLLDDSLVVVAVFFSSLALHINRYLDVLIIVEHSKHH